MAVAVKALHPKIQVIGVESTHTGNFAAALRAGKPVTVRRRPTLADGLAPLTVGLRSFELARSRVDRVVAVDEHWIALAILRLLELEKTVVEGSAAVPLAALMAGKLPELRGRQVALILSGGNIDPSMLGRVIAKGLVHDGRLTRFTATVTDRPGGLAGLTRVIADCGASIQDIVRPHGSNRGVQRSPARRQQQGEGGAVAARDCTKRGALPLPRHGVQYGAPSEECRHRIQQGAGGWVRRKRGRGGGKSGGGGSGGGQ